MEEKMARRYSWKWAISNGVEELTNRAKSSKAFSENDFYQFIYEMANNAKEREQAIIVIRQLCKRRVTNITQATLRREELVARPWPGPDGSEAESAKNYFGVAINFYISKLYEIAENERITMANLFLRELGYDVDKPHKLRSDEKLLMIANARNLGEKIVREELKIEDRLKNEIDMFLDRELRR